MNRDSLSAPNLDAGPSTLDDLLAEIRDVLGRRWEGAANGPLRPEHAREALASLLAFARAVEVGLSRATGGGGGAIRGHSASVRSYADHVLSGEGSHTAAHNLRRWMHDALGQLGLRQQSSDQSLRQQSQHIAGLFRAAAIERECAVPALYRWLGLEEIVFWREYKRRSRSLDADAIEDLVVSERRMNRAGDSKEDEA